MRLLADIHIAPRRVRFLRSLGHDVMRVDELLSPIATDEAIVAANAVLQEVLPSVEQELAQGAIATVQDGRVRLRRLPVE